MPKKIVAKKSARPVIAITGLRVERDALILDGLDWTVRRGEHWAILGANGSGKTSLLSTLTGYMPLTGGQIGLLGETYGQADWRELRKRIGIVSSSVHQMMAGHENTLETIISGRHAMIGGMSGVERDVIPYGLAMGDRARLTGINIIGMQRRGFSRDDIQSLRNAYNGLFADEGTLSERVDEVARRFAGIGPVDDLIAFIRADSSRAICQPKGANGG